MNKSRHELTAESITSGERADEPLSAEDLRIKAELVSRREEVRQAESTAIAAKCASMEVEFTAIEQQCAATQSNTVQLEAEAAELEAEIARVIALPEMVQLHALQSETATLRSQAARAERNAGMLRNFAAMKGFSDSDETVPPPPPGSPPDAAEFERRIIAAAAPQDRAAIAAEFERALIASAPGPIDGGGVSSL